MSADYEVGDLIYDANIYDGLNTFLSDLQFYKSGYRKIRRLKYLNCAVVQVDLQSPSPKMDTAFAE